MSITINKNVNLEASFEKMKRALEIIKESPENDRVKLGWLCISVEAHLEECTTSQDIPEDLFQQLGNYFKPE